jgi:alpha-L-rhamnosidase
MSYLFDGATFLRRHLRALRDTQEADGAYAAVAPVGGGFGGPLWSSVGIIMPWQSYLQYGDLDALSEHYASMKTYTELMLNRYIDPQEHYYRGTGGLFDLGDWLGFEVGKNDNSLIFDCYLTYELQIMANIAKALGKNDDAIRYEQERARRIDFINSHYIDPQTGKTVGAGFGQEIDTPFLGKYGPKRKGVIIDTQTSYAVPLAFGIVKEEKKKLFIQNFLNAVSRQSIGDDGKTYPAYSLMTGFIGTAWINIALSACGHSDEAYKMLLNRQFPSWLYPVDQGATSIWERLNSYTKDYGFGGNNSMNSFNHYAFGSVTNWLMQRSLGIASDEKYPGFKHFILRPEVDGSESLQYAQGYYDSMYGRIESAWKKQSKQVIYRFTLPANTSATLYLPVNNEMSISVNGKPLRKANEIQIKGMSDGKTLLEVPSGSYEFTVNQN